jgi:chromosome partitioning protein
LTGKIITIAQQKGGSGKTTLAAHLAVAWSMGLGQNVAILDVDPQGSLGEWLELREERLGEDEVGLSFKTASGWGARRESRSMARDYDLVIVDTPPHADRETRNAMELASLVIVPVQPTPADLWATEATINLAEAEGVPAVMVLNRVPPRARLTGAISESLAAFEAPIAINKIGNRVAYAESMGYGSTALEMQPNGKVSVETKALADELMKFLPS